jgi:hypothetical protein
MPRKALLVVAVAACAAGSCGKGKSGPTREAVLPLLQQEAQSLKRDGEKMDPALPVRSTWKIVAVEVREQPDEDHPFAGEIHFKISSDTKEYDGSVTTESFDRAFKYQYSSTLNKWVIQYNPPTSGLSPSSPGLRG